MKTDCPSHLASVFLPGTLACRLSTVAFFAAWTILGSAVTICLAQQGGQQPPSQPVGVQQAAPAGAAAAQAAAQPAQAAGQGGQAGQSQQAGQRQAASPSAQAEEQKFRPRL
ncbi:MAG: hypothetical protein QXT77_09875, partial [Candidatus Methanomethylicaceae archaeon]